MTYEQNDKIQNVVIMSIKPITKLKVRFDINLQPKAATPLQSDAGLIQGQVIMLLL